MRAILAFQSIRVLTIASAVTLSACGGGGGGGGGGSGSAVTTPALPTILPTSHTLLVNQTFTFTALDGITPRTFSVVAGSGTINATSGLYTAPAAPGSDTVRVTDSNGDHSDATVTILAALQISPSTKTLAQGNSTSFSAAGGQTPYTFSIVAGGAGGTINASTGAFTAPASSGSTTVRVTDALGNTSDATVTVNNALAISPSSLNLVVAGNQTFTASGGVSPYTFSRPTGTGTINASSGAYTAPGSASSEVVRVTDSLGNTADASINVYATLAISPSSVNLPTGGSQTFSASGGVAPYTYSLASGSGTLDTSAGDYVAPGTAGSVTVRVTDSIGNTADASVTVFTALAISPSSISLEPGASQAFSASGGVSPYTYALTAGAGTLNTSTGAYTAPNSNGSATIRVTDSAGNFADASISIQSTLALAPATSTVAVGAAISFSASGGTAPYTYSVSSGSGSINSTTGAYTAPGSASTDTVLVTDNLGNTASASVTVVAGLAISPSSKTLAVNNSMTFSVSGGSGPYTYSLVSGTGTLNTSTGAFTAPSVQGTTVVRVTDSLGATSDATVTINPALAISPSSVTVALNGAQDFNSSGGVGPFTYSVVAGSGTIDSTGLYAAPNLAGSATVRVTDSLGNTSNASVTITNALAINPASITVAAGNTVSFSGSGGSGSYFFSILSGSGTIDSSTGDYTAPSSAGTDTVRIFDGSTSVNATVTIVNALAISPSTVIKQVNTTQTFTTSGGVAPITFSIKSGSGTINASTGAYTAPASAGTDVVEATDSLGNTSDATVTVANGLTISPLTKKMMVNNTFTFTAGGGTAPYTFSKVSGNGTINSSTGVFTAPSAAGTTVVRVTDTNSFTSDATITIIEPSKLATGSSHTCAKFSDGSLKCWGYSLYGQTGLGNTNNRGDTANEMGDNLPFVDLGTGRTVVDVQAGSSHTCALLDNNTLKCWGRSSYGQLGQGNTNSLGDGSGEMGNSLATVNLGTGKYATSIAVGPNANHVCAILNDGNVKCWGRNTSGQLGYGDINSRGDAANEMGDSLPNVSLNLTASKVYTGSSHSCVISTTGTVKCWGSNSSGQLGIGSTTTMGDGANEMGANLPTVNLGAGVTATALALGSSHTCAITNSGAIKCWGSNSSGQLGNGSTTSATSPVSTTMGGLTASAIWAGSSNTCAKFSDGSTKCWGSGLSGQLGNASTTSSTTPVSVSLGTGRTMSSMGTGSSFNCAILDNKAVKCWGKNSSGQLGLGDIANRGDNASEMGDSLSALSF